MLKQLQLNGIEEYLVYFQKLKLKNKKRKINHLCFSEQFSLSARSMESFAAFLVSMVLSEISCKKSDKKIQKLNKKNQATYFDKW